MMKRSAKLPILLARPVNCERHGCLGRYYNFFLAGSCCDSSAGSAARSGANEGALASSGEASNQRTSSGSAADLSYVALGVAFTLKSVRARSNRLTVHFGKPYREQAGSMEPSTVLNPGYAALRRIADFG